MSPEDFVYVGAPGKAYYLEKNHEIEKRACRLRQFDIHETLFMNKYVNTNSFIEEIQIFGMNMPNISSSEAKNAYFMSG